MDHLKEKLTGWTGEIRDNHSPQWANLPELDLYMDQVIVLMEKYLDVFERGEDDKLVTPSMVNNYVKMGLISPPENKKYSRNHIARLMVVCILKQILPISNITELINSQVEEMPMDALFDLFGKEQDKALVGVADYVDEHMESLEGDEQSLSLLALKLTVAANANKLAAERIIELIKEEQQRAKELEKEKEKEEKERERESHKAKEVKQGKQ